MPVRSLTQSLLRWPEPDLVLRQVRDWAERVAADHPGLVQVGVFGSYGRGDAGVGSDLDLLLIDTDAVGPQRQRLLAWPLAELPLSCDALVLTPAEHRELLASGSAMAIALARDSCWLWGRLGEMTLAPPPATAETAGASLPPLLLPADLRLSPEQFARVCEANPEAVLELAADGQLIAMTPTGGDTGRRNSRLIAQLQTWADQQGGWEVFDSSTGFRLADGSVLSPDGSVVRLERWEALSPEQRRGFPPLCPDLVIELASPSDAGPRGETALRRKMAAYLANGAQLGWLLFPEQQAAEIWRAVPDAAALETPKRLQPATLLKDDELLPGLRLELAKLWAV